MKWFSTSSIKLSYFRCIQWPLESSFDKLLNWPIFYPFIKKDNIGVISHLGVVPSIAYFIWLILGLILPILPFIIHYFLPPDIEHQSFKYYLKITLGVFSIIPLVIYIFKSYIDNERNKNIYFMLHFDPRRVYLIIAISFLLIFVFINFASSGGHLIDKKTFLNLSTFGYKNNSDYLVCFLSVYTAMSILLIGGIYYVLHKTNILFFPYKINHSDSYQFSSSKSPLKAIFEVSSKNKGERYIPSRCFRGNDDYGYAIERLCLYLIFVKGASLKHKKIFFKPIKTIFFLTPIILPYIMLGVSVSHNVFFGVKADSSLKLIIWLSILIWGVFSTAYYHWLYLMYLEPLLTHNDRKSSKVEIKDFNFGLLEQAAVNSFTGTIATISQFILLTAIAAMIVYFNYLAY